MWRKECADIADRFADEHLRAYVYLFTGSMALFTGDPSDAVRSLAASLVLLREQQDMPMILQGLFLYGLALSRSGDSPAAQAACVEAIALAEERGELWAGGWRPVTAGSTCGRTATRTIRRPSWPVSRSAGPHADASVRCCRSSCWPG